MTVIWYCLLIRQAEKNIPKCFCQGHNMTTAQTGKYGTSRRDLVRAAKKIYACAENFRKNFVWIYAHVLSYCY